jgi:hypothetical protein
VTSSPTLYMPDNNFIEDYLIESVVKNLRQHS